MTVKNSLAAAAVATLMVTDASIATAQDGAAMKLGELKDLIAWANKMPPGPFSLNLKGEITAPTPCYEAAAEYAGDDKSNPPIYRVRITLIQKPGICIQKLTDIHFSYTQQNYVGNHQKMDVFSDKDSKIIAIDVIQ